VRRRGWAALGPSARGRRQIGAVPETDACRQGAGEPPTKRLIQPVCATARQLPSARQVPLQAGPTPPTGCGRLPGTEHGGGALTLVRHAQTEGVRRGGRTARPKHRATLEHGVCAPSKQQRASRLGPRRAFWRPAAVLRPDGRARANNARAILHGERAGFGRSGAAALMRCSAATRPCRVRSGCSPTAVTLPPAADCVAITARARPGHVPTTNGGVQSAAAGCGAYVMSRGAGTGRGAMRTGRPPRDGACNGESERALPPESHLLAAGPSDWGGVRAEVTAALQLAGQSVRSQREQMSQTLRRASPQCDGRVATVGVQLAMQRA